MVHPCTREQNLLDKTQAIVQSLDINPSQSRDISARFVDLLRAGLTQNAPIQIPSYVTRLPSGSESGTYLAVDLGGTNCRVCSVELHGDSTYTVVKSTSSVPREVRFNPSHRPLFGFIAEQIHKFLQEQFPTELKSRLKKGKGGASPRSDFWGLGFTFSFTCHQQSPRDGRLLRWDKDWDIPDAIGQNPCDMLQVAIDALCLPVHVAVLANDSVGTLLTRSYTTSTSSWPPISAIFGTGTNAAYVERLENVKRVHDQPEFAQREPGDFMIINTEWGGLDDEMKILPSTPYDVQLDKESVHPGDQMLEKRVAGLYLAELFRLVLMAVWKDGLFDMILDGDSPVFRHKGLHSSFLSQIANTPHRALKSVVSQMFGATGMSDNDIDAIRRLAAAVVRRSARLAGILLTATIIAAGHINSTSLMRKRPSVYRVTEHTEPRISSKSEGRGLSFGRLMSWLKKAVCIPPKSGNGSTAKLQSTSPSSSSAVLGWEDNDTIDVGVDGSLIQLYPEFEAEMRTAMRNIPDIGQQLESRLSIGFVQDGSAVGAALMALGVTSET
ncbi:hypothetical protein PV08_07033 [Exophiala spinifera]|uniref:Phosphotransferase n=1 Tax=Exophiala spinifera TaxID=91928 RepID=A0A0D1YGZ3_9EURO|nr:uncharacterized protein PV08_07033 [Exophiala spinifera]KIW14251.1 hypothetical protein PV08_07033 [Exophiala spinifera]